MNYSLTNFKKIILVAFVLHFTFAIIAQNDNDNHRKYWYYKSRLNNDFMKVGLGQGESIPCQKRGNDRSDFSNDPNVGLDWGDATSYLGYYIAILATEYKLLEANNQDTKKTLHELFCALNAVNRLDYVGETYFGGNTNLNGYFVRDDVPDGFADSNYLHFNYFDGGGNPITTNSLATGFMSKFKQGANKTSSSLISWANYTTTFGAAAIHTNAPIPEMSQDQAIAILYGLAFVKKFVPSSQTDNGATFGYGSGETSLTTEAENISSRIIKFIRDSKKEDGSPCLPNIFGWDIKNPVTCNPVGYNKNSLFGVGATAQLFSYPFAEAGCVIKSGLFGGIQGQIGLGTYPPEVCLGPLSANSYHNFYSSTAGGLLWEGLAPGVQPSGDNRLHVVNLSSICDCVYGRVLDKLVQSFVTQLIQIPIIGGILGGIISWIYQLVITYINIFVPGFFLNNTSTSINVNAYYGNYDFDHAPLSRKVLHGGFYQQNIDYNFKTLLDLAPCNDIYYLPSESPQYTSAQWSASDRIEHPDQRQGILFAGAPPGSGEYPGLDYLLYHNLWYIHELQQGTPQNIMDLSDTYVDYQGNTAPESNNYVGYETITFSNTIISPQNSLHWARAGKSIYFGPGSEIHTGPSNGGLHAYIDHYTCATNDGVFKSANGENSGYEYPNAPYHNVHYPNQTVAVINSNNIVNDQSSITELPNDEETITTDKITMKAGEFEVYPNPTNNTTKMYFYLNNKETAKVVVTDLVGKVLIEKENLSNVNNGNEVDLSGLAMGSYLIHYSTNAGITKSVKLIKTN